MPRPSTEKKQNNISDKKNDPLISPLDEHNERLLSHVHPDDYTNPIPKKRYHLVVIGAGPAGLIAAAGAAGLGAKVALIERHLMGGDCLNVGCVPSKAVIRASRSWKEAASSHTNFAGPTVSGPGDFLQVMARMRRLRADLSDVDSVSRFSELGVDVFQGEGRFLDDQTLAVGHLSLKFRRAVIATGARAAIPQIEGLRQANPLTNENLFELTQLPKRFAIIGAGPIGCEMAQAFVRFGSSVSLFERNTHILPREDVDAAGIIQNQLASDGVQLFLQSGIQKVEVNPTGKKIYFHQEGQKRQGEFDEILVSAGRLPNLEKLNLESAAIEFHERGITVNDRLQTSNPKVFAIGDVASKYQFTHSADAQARLVLANALFFGRGKKSKLVIPWCTYTQPEIAHVGFYESDAKEADYEVDTMTLALDELDRAVLDDQKEGFFRVHLKKGTDQILGATLVADHAGEMIGELAVAITHGLGLQKIGSTIHPYPTQSEVFRKMADQWRKRKLTPLVKKLLQMFFNFFQ